MPGTVLGTKNTGIFKNPCLCIHDLYSCGGQKQLRVGWGEANLVYEKLSTKEKHKAGQEGKEGMGLQC